MKNYKPQTLYKPPANDDEVITLDELDRVNAVGLEPEIHISSAMIRLQKMLLAPDLKEGMLRFRFMTEYILVLSRASKNVPPDFEEQIKAFKETPEYKEKSNDYHAASILLSMRKLEIILTYIFDAKQYTGPMKL